MRIETPLEHFARLSRIEEYGMTRQNIKKGKLVQKVPMSNNYIDEYDQMWLMRVYETGVCWIPMGIIFRGHK